MGEIDNEEEANDALLVQAAKETEALLGIGQMKRASTREEPLNMDIDMDFSAS